MWRQHGVFYQVDPRLFRDLDGDGVGDLRGLRDGLEHLRWLGVQAVWISLLLPWTATEVKGAGAVWPEGGIGLESPNGLARFVEAAHRLGLRVLVDVN
ncbi:MAG: hypothetical protein IT337_11140, partial [Thermomicrobiales bacterium]|nr:hypothetical protein [Thermomicrobiales bacterium]